MTVEALDDAQLLTRLRAKDDDAFDEVVKTYTPVLRSLATRMTHDEDLAHDIVQETFFAFYRAIETFEGKSSLFTFLYRIATNKSIDAVRKQKRKKAFDEKADKLLDVTAEDTSYQTDMKIVVEKALAELPLSFRTPLILAEYERLSYKDIAVIMNIPVNTVRTRIYRGREKLLGIFNKMGVSL